MQPVLALILCYEAPLARSLTTLADVASTCITARRSPGGGYTGIVIIGHDRNLIVTLGKVCQDLLKATIDIR